MNKRFTWFPISGLG